MTKKIQKNIRRGRALRIIFGFMIIAFLLVSCAAAAQPAGTESYHGKDVAANEVLVKFHAVTPEEIYKVKVKEDVDEAEPVGSTGAMRLHSKSKNVETLISDLSGDANVEYAEPDYVVYATLEPRRSLLWQPLGTKQNQRTIGLGSLDRFHHEHRGRH